MNFISNALKFTCKKGNVRVELNLKRIHNSSEKIDQLDYEDKKSLEHIMEVLKEDQSSSSTENYHSYIPKRRSSGIQLSESIHDQMLDINDKENKKLFIVEFDIKIIDSGKGISEDGLKKLFINFQSLKEHQGINKGGTGLGLSICK